MIGFFISILYIAFSICDSIDQKDYETTYKIYKSSKYGGPTAAKLLSSNTLMPLAPYIVKHRGKQCPNLFKGHYRILTLMDFTHEFQEVRNFIFDSLLTHPPVFLSKYNILSAVAGYEHRNPRGDCYINLHGASFLPGYNYVKSLGRHRFSYSSNISGPFKSDSMTALIMSVRDMDWPKSFPNVDTFNFVYIIASRPPSMMNDLGYTYFYQDLFDNEQTTCKTGAFPTLHNVRSMLTQKNVIPVVITNEKYRAYWRRLIYQVSDFGFVMDYKDEDSKDVIFKKIMTGYNMMILNSCRTMQKPSDKLLLEEVAYSNSSN